MAVPSPAPQVMILGAHGFTNVGDHAILAAMLAELREALPGARFLIPTRDATALAACDDATPLPFDDRAIRAALVGLDLLILGGGGLLFDFREIIAYDDFFDDSPSYFHAFCRAVVAAHGLGVPVQLYALGIGPLVGPAARGLTRTIGALATAITVRDTLSRRELLALGVPDERIEVTADPAVRLDVPAPVAAGDIPQVGFVIRNWSPIDETGPVRLPDGPAYAERYLDSFARAADRVAARWGGRAVFFAIQREIDDDQGLARRVLARMAHPDRARIIEEPGDHAEVRRLLGGLDLVVSTRLHGLIFAANAGVPGIGVNLNTKVRAWLADLGLDDLAVSPWDGRPTALAEVIDRVFARPDDYRARLATGMAAQRRAAERNPAISAALVAARRGEGAG